MPTTEAYANNASSPLNGSIDNVVTTLQVTSAATFPVRGDFRIKIDSEILIVTGVSGTTFTVVRGAEGTAAASHSSGATAFHILTADSIGLAGGWRTAYDLSISGSGSINADGNFSLGGKTWVKFNTASETVATTLDATGITFQPISATDYNGATRTLPGVLLPLNQVIPNFHLGMGVRIWAQVHSFNGTDPFDNAVIGIDSQSTALGYISKRGWGTGGEGMESLLNAAATNLGFFSKTFTIGSGNNMMVVEVPCVTGGIHRPLYGDANNWGDYTALSPAKTFVGSGTVDNSGATIANMSLLLGAQRANSGTSLSVTFSRIRVDYRQ